MKATKEIPIYLNQKRNVRQIDVVQYDTGIQLIFTVADFSVPSGATATLYTQKPSGKFVFQEEGITISGNKITVDLENQAIMEHGKVPYQISINSGADVITTFTGLIMVEKSMKDAGATESMTVIRAFDEAVSARVADFQTKAEQIVQACIATIPADYSSMEARVRESATAVKGYLSGAVVFADDVSPVAHSPVVKVHGKNLCSTSEKTIDSSLAYAGEGVSFKGVSAKQYTVSADFEQLGAATQIGLSIATDEGKFVKECYSGETAGTISLSFVYPINANSVITNFFSNLTANAVPGAKCQYTNIQIEEGLVATEYEPYIDPSTVTVTRYGADATDRLQNYVPNADGTVPGITSLSPNMTILTDTEGVIVECEYNRDTNKVIEKLTNAITALGGTI